MPRSDRHVCDRPHGEGGDLGCIEPIARLFTHESRTPLNAIIGFAELLLAGGSGPLSADARAWVANIASAARDLESAMAAAANLVEIGLLPPRGAAAALALRPLLAQAGFEVEADAGQGGSAGFAVILGTPDRWAGILDAVRGFLVRRADGPARCRARPLAASGGGAAAGLRLWSEPGLVAISDLGRVELSLAARLAAAEGATLTLGRHADIRLLWPRERVVALDKDVFSGVVTAPNATSDVLVDDAAGAAS